MPAASVKRLSVRERRFLLFHVEGNSLTEAYLQLKPEADRVVAATLGCRMFRRILKKTSWGELMKEAGLGEIRILRELEAALTAKKEIFYEGKSVATVEDNQTKMRALELLADLLGKRKQSLDVHTDEIVIRAPPRPEQLVRLDDSELAQLRYLTEKMLSTPERKE